MLAPLRFVLPGDHLAAPGCRLPVDMTDVVARHPLPQRLEQASLAQPADRRNARLRAPPRLCHRAPEPHRHERRVRHRVPRESDPLSLPAEPERARAVCDHRSSPLAAPTYRHHGKRLAGLAAWADRHAPRALRPAQDVRPHFAHPEPEPPARAVDPAIDDRAHQADREGGCHFALHHEIGRPGTDGAARVEPDAQHERQVGDQHGVERARRAEAEHTDHRQGCAERQRAPRRQDHVVGTSVLSSTAWRAASGVTPSSSSSGATLTRCRSTAGAIPFTSSGIT